MSHNDSSPRDADIVSSVDAVRRIVRALRVAAAGVEKTTGLSAAQLFVLERVADNPGSSLTELAEMTLTDRTSVAAVVERLTARGFVERRRSTIDRRRVDVEATEAGKQLLGNAPHAPTAILLDGLRTLGDTELHQVADGLRRLERAMGVADQPAGLLFEDTPAVPAALGPDDTDGAA